MVEIDILATGSAGNAYLVKDGMHKILIECGIDFKIIQERLNFETSSLDAVLISHEHKDHAKSARNFIRVGIPMVMSDGTMVALGIDPTFVEVAKSEQPMTVGKWRVLPFAVEHDSVEPLGFLIMSPSGKKILYATDTCYLRYKFKGVNYYLIEANYQESFLLENDSINNFLKDRIRRSHFEIGNCINFLRACDLGQTEKIHLLHLSDHNADRQTFVDRVMDATGIPTY